MMSSFGEVTLENESLGNSTENSSTSDFSEAIDFFEVNVNNRQMEHLEVCLN